MLLQGRSAAAQRPSAAPRQAGAQRSAAAPRPIMSRNGLRRVCAITAAALIPAMAGCEAGSNAPVLQWHPPTAGASASVSTSGAPGSIAILNVFVLGAPPSSTLPAGGSAGVFLALVNTGPKDRLVSISAPGTATSVRLPKGGVTVPEDQSALLTGPAPTVILDGLTHSLPGGTDVRMVLTFQNAGNVSMDVPVMPKAQYYATFSPAPAPTPSPTGKHPRRARASATATPSASGTATATPSATPTPTATP
jgi:copper(I)-binding protein